MTIGLTGGIASGKTAVAHRLTELGAYVIDADDVYAELVRPGGELLAALAQRFGADIIAPDGALDRSRLAEIVFFDGDSRAELNAMTHPAIIGKMHALAAEYHSLHSGAPAFLDMALLIECGEQTNVDEVWLVTAPDELRIARMMLRDGCTEMQARARIAAQMPQTDKLKYAGVIIDNDGTVDELMDKVDALYAALVADYE